jgi:hypothetical protein
MFGLGQGEVNFRDTYAFGIEKDEYKGARGSKRQHWKEEGGRRKVQCNAR